MIGDGDDEMLEASWNLGCERTWDSREYDDDIFLIPDEGRTRGEDGVMLW